MEHETIGPKTKKGLQGGASVKLLIIGFLVILFLIPSVLIHNLIEERSHRQRDAITEVSSKWSNQQGLVGPVLVLPYTNYDYVPKSDGGSDITPENYAYFLPKNLSVNGDVKTETRSRGIYEVPLYTGIIDFSGEFLDVNLEGLNLQSNRMLWDQSFVLLGVSDIKGIEKHVELTWNDTKQTFLPSTHTKLLSKSIQVPVKLKNYNNETKKFYGEDSFEFSFQLNLKGSKGLSIFPLGQETNISLKSDWGTPSFSGNFLPSSHNINDSGFDAEWTLLDLNRALPQQWTTQDKIFLDQNSFLNKYKQPNNKSQWVGFELFSPVDIYQKTTRAAKYAMAIIVLVFMIFFLVEMIAKKRIHPLQYILIGLALIIFYTLLLSLSEYIPFFLAYLISSVAIIGMITLFAKSVTKSWKIAGINGGILALLYVFIYVLLASKDYTLLIGSVGLFVILGIVMYASKYINWYREN